MLYERAIVWRQPLYSLTLWRRPFPAQCCALWLAAEFQRGRKYVSQTCHFDLTQNLNECDKKSEYTEMNLNLTTKIALLYRNLYQIQSQKKSEFWVS